MKSSTIAQKLSLQQLVWNLKNLNEESDMSREQGLSPCFADESMHSIVSKLKEQSTPIIKDIGGTTLVDICKKRTESNWAHGHEASELSSLKQTNKKLVQDNKILIKECIRLRMLLKSKNIQYADQKDYCAVNNVQLINIAYLNQINKLKTQNLQLKISQCNSKSSYLNSNAEVSSLLKCVQEIKANSEKLTSKIEEIMEKDKNVKLSRSNTTTTASRMEDNNINGADKVINNMKVAYEGQLQLLRKQIQIQKQQINRLNVRQSTYRSYHSPPKPKPY